MASDGFEISHGIIGGAEQSEFISVPYGKASRSQRDQIISESQSRIKKRIESGYSLTIEEAQQKSGRGANQIGLPRPMLAMAYKNLKEDSKGWYHQPKLDGHRCLIKLDGSDTLAYSRNGKHIESIQEIIEELSKLPDRLILDGELYCHGTPLQRITSWVKRRQDETDFLEYWVYDYVNSELPFKDRIETVRAVLSKSGLKRVRVCPTTRDFATPAQSLKNYRDLGYEGAILRNPESPYSPSRRSKGVVKVKAWEDDEFIVHNITSSADGWAILHLKTKDGKSFAVSAPGNVEQKTFVLKNSDAFIGQSVRVEYANFTSGGIPFHPIATMWRNKEDE